METQESLLAAFGVLSKKIEELEKENARLRAKIFRFENADKEPSELAIGYMREVGESKWEADKLGTIMRIRDLTDWDLAKAKRWGENYMEAVWIEGLKKTFVK